MENPNCECTEPKPSGAIEVGEYEGVYEICKTCNKRVWH